MYERKQIDNFNIMHAPLVPFGPPLNPAQIPECLRIDIESEENKHKINCCLYISRILCCVLGGGAGFLGANSAAQSFGFSGDSSFAFGCIGFSAISIIGLKSLPSAPVRGDQDHEFVRDRKQKLLSILNPIAGLACGMLTSKTADSVFSSLGFAPNSTSSALNIILAFTAGISSYIAIQASSNARNDVNFNWESFISQQTPTKQFILKFLGCLCFIASLVVILCLLPSITGIITNYFNDELFTKIASYLSFGAACYGISDLYFNCFKIFTEKCFYLVQNFGVDKFKNILSVIAGSIFLFVQGMSSYGLGVAGGKGTSLTFDQPESKTANMICGVVTAIGMVPASVLSGFSIAESAYEKSYSLYRYVRSKFQ